LPWDNNSWDVAAQIALRNRQQMAAAAAVMMASGGATVIQDTPLPLRDAAARIPQLLMQSIIVPGDKTIEGRLIEAVALPWFDIIDEVLRNPTAVFEIPPDKWEEIIAGAYKKAGFDEVTLTPRSGDHGRDVIAVKKGLGSVRVIDQVKAYKPDHLVTANDVRALMGALQGDTASKGFLTTTSDFAPRLRKDPLIACHIPTRLELIDGKALLSRLGQLAGATSSSS